LLLYIITCAAVECAATGGYVPNDYIWSEPSVNSAGSMPCGGHDIGLNVWAEGGDLLFYIARSGFFDENNTLLKAGRWRLHIGAAFDNSDGSFSQRLCLNDGAMYVSGKGVEVRLWADVFTPRVFVEIKCKKSVPATLSYESWRYRDRPLTKAECQQCSYKWTLPKQAMTFKDEIAAAADSLTFIHRNKDYTVFDHTVHIQGLDSIKSALPDPIGGLVFGGVMQAPGFSFAGVTDGSYASTDCRSWNYTAAGIRQAAISISLRIGGERAENVTPAGSKRRSAKWWHAFWQRSHIAASDKDNAPAELLAILRNYELTRYMLGCNAFGQWPSKFNGSLFTFDPVYVDKSAPFTPDYRKWGGGTMTAQNQRLLYWPALKSGDAVDVLLPQLDTYLRMLPAATARTRLYWGHEGASYTEQIENFGLPNPAEYGKHKPGDDPGNERNAWLEYQWDTSLEFCSMALQANSYSGVSIAKYEEMIRQCLLFYDLHYQQLALRRGVKPLNGEGKLVLYPTSGCETYKMAYNSASVIAALQTVARQAIEYCKRNAAADTLLYMEAHGLLSRLPDIPLRAIDGKTCIAPAVAWERVQNVETPQLYPVWPWRIYGLGRKDINTAINTYLHDPHALKMRSSKGWKQDNIWAACLGLKDEAQRLITEKFADGPYRFAAFNEPAYDWAPDLNKAGAAMAGLQEMLLQEAEDGSLLLFPAWPSGWNVSFRLHATSQRTVEAAIHNGKITSRILQEP